MITAFDVDAPSQRSLALTSCHQITNPRNVYYYSAQFSFLWGHVLQAQLAVRFCVLVTPQLLQSYKHLAMHYCHAVLHSVNLATLVII